MARKGVEGKTSIPVEEQMILVLGSGAYSDTKPWFTTTRGDQDSCLRQTTDAMWSLAAMEGRQKVLKISTSSSRNIEFTYT